MAFRKFFGRSESNKSHDAFRDWPELPVLRLPQFPLPKSPPRLKPVNAEELKPEKYGYSLIIGLGRCGRLAAQGWLERLRRDTTGFQRNVRLVIISDNPVGSLTSEQVKIRQFDFNSSSPINEQAANSGSISQGVRAETQRRFGALSEFIPFRNYLNTAVRELVSEMDQRSDVRVILVAALDEAEMGMLGDLLQLLQAVSRNNGLRFANITLLLALNSPTAALDEAEQVAALREIGRFTFGGRHLMNNLPYVEEPSIEGALLDFVFLIEDKDVGRASEALTESLFILLHPSSAPIWENLRNDLSQAGNARSDTHLPFVNSLGIATLFVPVDEIKQYVSSRLAYAAVFGELNEPEGLLAKGQMPISHHMQAEKIAWEWLLNGPQSHPFWRWLLEINGPQQFQSVPKLDNLEAYRLAFQAQLAHGLMKLLNDAEQVDTLQKTAVVLDWLFQKFDQLQSWCRHPALARKGESLTQLIFLLESFHAAIKDFQQQIAEWESVLGISSLTDEKSPTLRNASISEAGRRSSSEDWRSLTGEAAETPGSAGWRVGTSESGQSGGWRAQLDPASEGSDSEVNQSLHGILTARRLEAEQAFSAIVNSNIKRPLTYNSDRPLYEVTKYYEDTIRPELSRHGLSASPRFQRVRERLGWWVDLPRNRPPELLLICIAANAGELPQGIPFPESRFRPEDVARLCQSLLEIAMTEAQTVVTDLTGPWIMRQLERLYFRDFLAQAEQPMLNYDQGKAISLAGKYASITRRYIIGRDRSLTGSFKEAAFRNISASEVNDVPETEPYLLSALSLRLNIPLPTIKWYERSYERYNHQEALHLYQPEKLAARYENSLSRTRRQRYEFPPELTMNLSDERLVSLFCQAAITGLIRPIKGISDQVLSGQLVWALTMENDSPNWTLPLELGGEDGSWRGLWQAMRHFTLEFPFGEEIRRNPGHPFYGSNREQFLTTMIEAIRELRRDVTGFQKESVRFETDFIKNWEKNLQADRLGQALVDLLKIEIVRPIWRGW